MNIWFDAENEAHKKRRLITIVIVIKQRAERQHVLGFSLHSGFASSVQPMRRVERDPGDSDAVEYVSVGDGSRIRGIRIFRATHWFFIWWWRRNIVVLQESAAFCYRRGGLSGTEISKLQNCLHLLVNQLVKGIFLIFNPPIYNLTWRGSIEDQSVHATYVDIWTRTFICTVGCVYVYRSLHVDPTHCTYASAG